LSLSKTSACLHRACRDAQGRPFTYRLSPLLTRSHTRLTRNNDSKAIEKKSPHSNDLIKSVFITNFHGGGALVS
jgi:hypothetical protein